MTVTDRFRATTFQLLAVLGAMALALVLLPPQTASGQEPPAEPANACPEDAPPAGFADRDTIPPAHRMNVDCAAHFGIVQGFADNTYRPRLEVRRDQMASFIALTLDAAGVDLPAGDADIFTDVGADNVHAVNINRLAAVGIVEGGPEELGPDAYGANRRTRRDQMASFLMRAAGYALHSNVDHYDSPTQQFSDVPEGNVHFAKVNTAAENNIALGTGDGVYGARVQTTRDQMASFVVRILNFIEGGGQPLPGPNTPGSPGSPGPGTNTPNPALAGGATVAPELTNARIVETNPDNIVVAYRFDEGVQTANAPGFRLYSFDAGPTPPPTQGFSGTSAQIAGNTVNVTFGVRGNEASYFTVATVKYGAVTDFDGHANPESDAPLFGGRVSGFTQGPDLVGLEFQPAQNRVNFLYDEPVAAGSIPVATYLLVDRNNNVVGPTGATADPNRPNVARVQFANIATTTQANTARAITYGVADLDGNVNPFDAYDVCCSGRTDAPDLVGVTLDEAAFEVRFEFTEPVVMVNPNAFFLVHFDTTSDTASTANVDPGQPRVVVAEFGPGQVERAVRAVAAAGAVAAVADIARVNSLDVHILGNRSFVGGVTNAPDLVDALVEAGGVGGVGTTHVVYDFDQTVDLFVNSGFFYLYDELGNRFQATACERFSTDVSLVRCVFGADTATSDTRIAQSVLATVDNDETNPNLSAVQDHNVSDRNNPEGATRLRR